MRGQPLNSRQLRVSAETKRNQQGRRKRSALSALRRRQHFDYLAQMGCCKRLASTRTTCSSSSTILSIKNLSPHPAAPESAFGQELKIVYSIRVGLTKQSKRLLAHCAL